MTSLKPKSQLYGFIEEVAESDTIISWLLMSCRRRWCGHGLRHLDNLTFWLSPVKLLDCFLSELCEVGVDTDKFWDGKKCRKDPVRDPASTNIKNLEGLWTANGDETNVVDVVILAVRVLVVLTKIKFFEGCDRAHACELTAAHFCVGNVQNLEIIF